MPTFATKSLAGLVGLLAVTTAACAGVLKDHPGLWLGELKLPNGHAIKLGVDVFVRADGSPWASLASPDQGNYDQPVVRVTESGETAELGLDFGTLRLAWADGRFDGEWRQNGSAAPLVLERVPAFPRQRRPQDPVQPVPYAEQTLAVPGADGVMLGATLSLPPGVARPDVAILVAGSGPTTRDEEGDGHRPFAVLADYLARRGIAVLRYDKRGIGRSTGDYENVTQAQLVADLDSVARAMRARKQFDRVGLIGHSEGPMLAAAVAAQHPGDVDFLVSLAGVGLPGVDLMLLQDRLEAADKGADAHALDRLTARGRGYYDLIVAQPDPQARVAAVKAFEQALSADDKALVEQYKMNEGSLSPEMAGKPWLRDVLAADPRADWRRVRCPVLVLNGSLDHQVPPESLAAIVASLREGGNAHVESAVLPSLNHDFQTARTGSEDEYGDIDETLAPVALQRIAAFVGKQR